MHRIIARANALGDNAAMHSYQARIEWQRGDGEAFVDQRYSRRHLLHFDGGAQWLGSSSPAVVPLPMSDASAVDPEEAFVASLASCHMLWFLSIAAARGFCVDHYEDPADGLMSRNEEGRMAMTLVTLRPKVVFGGATQPTPALLHELHHKAHDNCFIANSVKTEVRCVPRL